MGGWKRILNYALLKVIDIEERVDVNNRGNSLHELFPSVHIKTGRTRNL